MKIHPNQKIKLSFTNAAILERVARVLITYGYQGPESVVEMSRKIVHGLKSQ